MEGLGAMYDDNHNNNTTIYKAPLHVRKSLQWRHTTYATRIKLMKIKVENTTVKTNES